MASGNIQTDSIPARVAALAAQIGDDPIAWNEHDDGTIVIVFNQKGKRTFSPSDPAPVGAHSVPLGEHVAPSPIETKSPRRGEASLRPPRPSKEK